MKRIVKAFGLCLLLVSILMFIFSITFLIEGFQRDGSILLIITIITFMVSFVVLDNFT